LHTLPSLTTSGSLSIIGTRKHEWGADSPRNSSTRPGKRDSLESVESSNLSALSPIDSPVPKDDLILQSPLDTVPDRSKIKPHKSEVHEKNLRRRAQIFTEDKLAEAAIIFSAEEKAKNDRAENIASEEAKAVTGAADIIQGEAEIVKETLGIIQEELRNPAEYVSLEQVAHDDDSDSGESAFSFERDNKAGRNTSIRYYKSEQEKAHIIDRQPGFYVDDLIEDDDFDDDMNYLDDDDEFNDDEELFNRKYFSDDEEGAKVDDNQHISNTVADEIEPKTPTGISQGSQRTPKHDSNQENSLEKPTLTSKRSLKYYQLPEDLDQSYDTDKYSFLDDDYNERDIANDDSYDSYDSFLDEINNVPEDFEFEAGLQETSVHQKKGKPHNLNYYRSKSWNSSQKPAVFENSYQNSKFQTQDKTVTLFNRSRENSIKSKKESDTSANNIENFVYLTPNSSFTSPNPGFINDKKILELSPISEGSIDGSP
jgi:hypothetical protein